MYELTHYVTDDDGRLIPVLAEGGQEGSAPDTRNAGPRDHRRRPPGGSGPPGPRRPRTGGYMTSFNRPLGSPDGPRFKPAPRHEPEDRPTEVLISLKKRALVELVPAAGEIWASILQRPDMPRIVGDDIVDRTNATMHRDALAMHEQNQRRILALSSLAERLVNVFMD